MFSMNRLFIFLTLIVSIAMLSGCDGGGDPPLGHLPGENQYGVLRLNNASGATIDDLYVFLPGSSYWGVDRLGADTLATGSYFDVPNIPVGTYDARIRVYGIASDYYGYYSALTITSNATYSIDAVPSTFTGSLKIVNAAAGADIFSIYIVPSPFTTWGSNHIAAALEPGGDYHWRYMQPSNYDVRIVWESGPDSFYYNNAVSSLALTTLNVN